MAAVAVAMLAAALPTFAGEPVTLAVHAGLGGAARAGRWTPVRISIDNHGGDVSGELVVEWGDARVHRDVDLPSPFRTEFEIYVRTTDVRDSIAVRLTSDGRTIASVDTPIRVVPYDTTLVTCVGDHTSSAIDSACTSTTAPGALPRSLRGFAAADEVRISAGQEIRLAPAQRAALREWRVHHDLEARDLLSRAPRAPALAAVDDRMQTATAVAASFTLAPLLCSACMWVLMRRSVFRAYATLACALLVGTVGSAAAGRVGPGSDIVVRHGTTLQQVGDRSLVAMRGTIEFPAFGAYAIRVQGLDGTMTSRSSTGGDEWLDSNGAPVRRGTFGRGARDDVEVEGVIEFAPFEVADQAGGVVRVANRSESTLSDCRFPQGFSRRDFITLRPGESVEARASEPVDAPFFTCTVSAPLTFSDARVPVRLQGPSIASVLLPVPPIGGDRP